VARGIIRIRHVITKNDLRTWIIGISSIAEELGHILNVLVAALELVFAASVVDSDQEGLLPRIGHDWDKVARSSTDRINLIRSRSRAKNRDWEIRLRSGKE